MTAVFIRNLPTLELKLLINVSLLPLTVRSDRLETDENI